MTEQLLNTLAGAGLALTGVLLANLIAFGQEILRRKWAIQDKGALRYYEVLDRRCDQAERYAEAVTEDYRRVMHDCQAYLSMDDPFEAKRRRQQGLAWKDNLDKKVFALGPAIRALKDSAISKSWDAMMDSVDVIQGLHMTIYHSKFGGGPPADLRDCLAKVTNAWLSFSGHLGDFYRRLDEIRARTPGQ